jgi:hypothetical protein
MQQFRINQSHRKFPAHIQKIKFPSNARLSYTAETTIKLGDMSQVPMSESMMNYLDIMKSRSGLMGCRHVHTTGLRTTWL